MRKLTLSKNFHRFEYDLLEEKLNTRLPNELFVILENYSGYGVEESKYFDKKNELIWILSSFCDFSYMYDMIDELKEEKLSKKLLPFAIEEGDWLFCISLEENFPVYIFKTSDYSGDDAIQLISDSLESFIEGLERSSE